MAHDWWILGGVVFTPLVQGQSRLDLKNIQPGLVQVDVQSHGLSLQSGQIRVIFPGGFHSKFVNPLENTTPPKGVECPHFLYHAL